MWLGDWPPEDRSSCTSAIAQEACASDYPVPISFPGDQPAGVVICVSAHRLVGGRFDSYYQGTHGITAARAVGRARSRRADR